MNRITQPGAVAAARDADQAPAGGKFLAAGGFLAALGASACCVLPFALLTLGVGGAWMSNLTWLAPYEKVFMAVAVLLLAAGFWRVYRRPASCSADGCPPASNRPAKVGLWMATVLVLAAIAFPYVAPFL